MWLSSTVVFLSINLIMLSVFSDNILILWFLMEGVTLMSIMLMMMFQEKSIQASNSGVMFIIISGFSSSMAGIFIFAFTCGNNDEVCLMILMMFLFMKLGVWPVHSWVLKVFVGLNLKSILILSSLPKVVPMKMLWISGGMCSMESELIVFTSLMYVMSTVISVYPTTVKGFVGASSVMQMPFATLMGVLSPSQSVFFIFLGVYLISNSLLVYCLESKSTKKGVVQFTLFQLSGWPLSLMFFWKLLLLNFLLMSGAGWLLIFAVFIGMVLSCKFYYNFFVSLFTCGWV